MVVAQLVELLLPTPEIRGSNPDIGKILSTNCTIEKTKIKKKKPGMAHLKKRFHYFTKFDNLRLKNESQVLRQVFSPLLNFFETFD